MCTFAWVARVFRGAMRQTRLGPVDRVLGFFAGAALGFLFVTAGYLAWGSLVPSASIETALRGSLSGPWMARTVEALAPLVPEDQRRRWGGLSDGGP